MNKGENIFVFVVCGEKKHIETLHFALRYISHFSSSGILVVTDSLRNEIPVAHSRIVDVNTPSELNHHQASIWLKTSLHRILPQGPMYCYLDSDVIAVNDKCDEIFSHFNSPVTFAADHCRLKSFSPYAVNCGCLEQHLLEKESLENAIKNVVNLKHYPPDYRHIPTRNLFSALADIRSYPLKNIWPLVKLTFAFASGKAQVKNNLILDVKNKTWSHDGFLYPFLYAYRKEIKKRAGYRFSLLKKSWLKPDGHSVAALNCHHLADAIEKLTGIRPEDNWQHWNGGVFLFNHSSFDFMEKWHNHTNRIFKDTYWKTRDQGTLAATVWEMGLARQAMLPEAFNMIADFYKPEIKVMVNISCLTLSKGSQMIEPSFVHIYHEFGNEEWDLWRSVVKINPEG